jgi:rhodanese-related sulfurtransferase
MDMKICSTIGFEKAHNPTLAIEREEQFVADSLAKLGPQPPNFQRIVALNRGPLVTTGVEVPALYPHQVQVKADEGALLVDVRTDLQFDDVHIEGSVCIPSLSSGFGSKLAWLADHDQEIVFIGRDDADGLRAGKLALAVGVRNIAGMLAGGMTNWRQERHPAVKTERLAAGELIERVAREPELQLLDVRERAEWDAGHVPGSLFVPWHDIDGIPDELDAERPVAVMCSGGVRAGTAASLLRRYGAEQVLDGGVLALERRGVQLERGEPAAPVSG